MVPMPNTTPAPPNTTCDVYHQGNAPPSPPDVAAVPVFLQGRFRNLKPTATVGPYTHVMHVAIGVDVRSGNNERVYIPNKNGTLFDVVFVQRIRAGGGNDYKEVYLNRQAVNWPSDNL
jgi:hypothetical protein